MPAGGLPYAGTPEMDVLVTQIGRNPMIMGQLPPELVAEVLKHVGVERGDLEEVAAAWTPDDAAAKTMGATDDSEGEETSYQQAALPPNEEATSDYNPAQADEEEEEEAPASGSEPIEETDESQPGVLEANTMPRGRMPQAPQAAADPMDELISAQMMERSVGNPNAPVPAGKNVGRMQRPALKGPATPTGITPQQAMIQQLVRQAQSGKGRKQRA